MTTQSIGISPLISVTYSVTGTLNNCPASPAFAVSTVTVNKVPLISVNSSLICHGNTANLTVSGATSYVWSTGETTPAISVQPLITTTYTVTGSEPNGCSDIKTSVVTVEAPVTTPVISYNNPVCIGSVLNLIINNDSLKYQYTWTGPDGFNSILHNPAINNVSLKANGTYSVFTTLINVKVLFLLLIF